MFSLFIINIAICKFIQLATHKCFFALCVFLRKDEKKLKFISSVFNANSIKFHILPNHNTVRLFLFSSISIVIGENKKHDYVFISHKIFIQGEELRDFMQ